MRRQLIATNYEAIGLAIGNCSPLLFDHGSLLQQPRAGFLKVYVLPLT